MTSLKINILVFIFCLYSANLFAQTQNRDIVELKNGSIIKGIMLELVMDGSIKIETADGSLFIFKAEEVLKVTKEKAAIPLNTPPPQKVVSTPNVENNNKIPENIGTSNTTEPLIASFINKGLGTDDHLFCEIKVENITDKDITGVQANMYVFDETGKEIHSFRVYINSETVEIKAREVKTLQLKDGFFEGPYNQFQEEDRLFKNTDISKLKYKWEVKQVVFSDGTAFDKKK